MMKLSIIIVNYNVKYFLKQCLNSVLQSAKKIDCEIIVVDNDSSDGSVEMIKENFPSIHLIVNKKNVGFGKANNQAIQYASGEFVLLLNPDTLISEESLTKPIKYLENNKEVGALGVKLIDGSGNYHMESKRGFPNIWNAFCKMSGIYKLFEKSRLFNYYYQGHLDNNQIQSIDVLCGAYFLSRIEILKKHNGFDEDFFMYGEDIDLSYRIKQDGHKIIYFPDSSIIHFKGESSKKLNWVYIKSFYGAMNIYLKKHQKGLGRLLIPLLSIAVFGMALVTYLVRVMSTAVWALFNLFFFFFSFQLSSNLWATWYHNDSTYYDHKFIMYLLLLNAFVYVFMTYVFGLYDSKKTYSNIFKGITIGLLVNMLIYALLPETVRFSRVLILGFGLICLFITSIVFYFDYYLKTSKKKKITKYLIVGNKHSAGKLNELLVHANNENIQYAGYISPDEVKNDSLGRLEELENILDQLEIDDVIFSTKDLQFKSILKIMSDFGDQYNYKLASNDNVSILSSKFAKKQGEIITIDLNFNIQEPVNKRIKRIMDIIAGISLIFLAPVLLIFSKSFRKAIKNIPSVVLGSKHLIGYENKDGSLPKLKPAMFNIGELFSKNADSLRINYAKSYRPLLDLEYLLQALKNEK